MYAVRIDLEDDATSKSFSNESNYASSEPGYISISNLPGNEEVIRNDVTTLPTKGNFINSLKVNEDIERNEQRFQTKGNLISLLKCNVDMEPDNAMKLEKSSSVYHQEIVPVNNPSTHIEQQRDDCNTFTQEMISMECFRFLESDRGSIMTDLSSSYNGYDFESSSATFPRTRQGDYTVNLQLENGANPHAETGVPQGAESEPGLSYRLVSTGQGQATQKGNPDGNFMYQQVIATDSPRNHIFMRNFSAEDAFRSFVAPPKRHIKPQHTTQQHTSTTKPAATNKVFNANLRREKVQVHRSHSMDDRHLPSNKRRVRNVVMEPNTQHLQKPPTPVVVPPSPPPVVEERPVVDTAVPNDWRVNAPLTIQVNTAAVGSGSVNAFATGPSGRRDELRVHKVDDHLHHLVFTPTEKGQWQLDVTYNGSLSSASPQYINVYDASLARLIRSHFGPTQPGHPYSFEVDCGPCGLNEVHAIAQQDGRTVECHVIKSGMDHSTVTFTPPNPGMFTVHAFIGGVDIPDSPFTLEAEMMGDVSASGEGLHTGIVGKKASFKVDTTNFPGKSLNAVITAPSGQTLYADMDMQGTVLVVSYTPQEQGSHNIDLKYGGRGLPGCPYIANIRTPRVYVKNLQPVAYRNQEARFEVDASEFSKGTIELDSNLPVRRYDKIGDRKYEVTIIPMKTGTHDLAIKMDNREVEGSPYQVNVQEPQRY